MKCLQGECDEWCDFVGSNKVTNEMKIEVKTAIALPWLHQASKEQISVRVLVDGEKNKVVFVEAGKDFADVLLSFLTLPLGTIARLVNKESNVHKVSFGGLSSLYKSVVNIEEEHFWTDTCIEMLLQPRNPMENYCQNLKLNIDDTENKVLCVPELDMHSF
ncbi:hypothetical protein VNO77_20492 [Canavalia gladiata]|uniref:Uncharacterized protein n=1 Tax=Canavalia gladiata TaxID=3824 RepID=A0AAN9LPH7_CANGL